MNSPYILEERKMNVASVDIFSRMLLDRIIFLNTEINDDTASIIQAQLLYLESVNENEPISLYINSPGGSVTAGLGIYDTMQLVKPKVNTICVGMAASMAAILLSAGDKRYILPHSRVMIHQPIGGAVGQASDILIEAKEIEKCRQELAEIIAKHSNQEVSKVLFDMDRDYWMNSKEAVKYGIVDKIL